MNVVDSSGWLEYFADGPNAEFFAAAIENDAARDPKTAEFITGGLCRIDGR